MERGAAGPARRTGTGPAQGLDKFGMFGLDDLITSYSEGAAAWIVLLVAMLLGLRHATDPDHIAAVTTLVAGTSERATRAAGALGAAWGLGHATTLFAFGVPILLLDRYLPERVQQFVESAIAVVIAYLAVRLVVRWRRGLYHAHVHDHDGIRHAHVHSHARDTAHAHPHRGRTKLGSFAIGLVHGLGGSAGVGILLVSSIGSQTLGLISLALLAVFTGVSMTIISTGFGAALAGRPFRTSLAAVAPGLGVASLAFAVWYGAAAWTLAPYPF
jgi:ABC-type nickel/cobalt efflux system permease component RcnA